MSETETTFTVDGVSYTAVPSYFYDSLKSPSEPAGVEKRTFSAEQRREMAAKGQAMRDGSWPIIDAASLSDAIRALGRGTKSTPTVKAHIIRRAKALGLADRLPDDWNVSKAAESLASTLRCELLSHLLLEEIAKHARHDQKTHGHRFGAAGGAAAAVGQGIGQRAAARRQRKGEQRAERRRIQTIARTGNRELSRGMRFKSRRTGPLSRRDEVSRKGTKIGEVSYTRLPTQSPVTPNYILIKKVATTADARPGDGGRLVQRALNRSGSGRPVVSKKADDATKQAVAEWGGRSNWQKMTSRQRVAFTVGMGQSAATAAVFTPEAIRAANRAGVRLGGTADRVSGATSGARRRASGTARNAREYAGRRWGPPGRATVNVRGRTSNRRSPYRALGAGSVGKAVAAELEANLTDRIRKHARHNQKTHGKRGKQVGKPTPPGQAAYLERQMGKGGTTYSPVTGVSPTSGWAVAKAGKEEFHPADTFNRRGREIASDFVRRNSADLSKPDTYIGLWKDTDRNRAVLDVVNRITDTDEAVRVARRRNQWSIFNLGTFEELVTERRRGRGSPRGPERRRNPYEPYVEKARTEAGGRVHPPSRRLDRRSDLRGLAEDGRNRPERGAGDAPEPPELPELTSPVVKADAHRRYTLAPLYIPDRLDAHREHTDAETLQKAVWSLVRKGDRSLRLQHDTSVIAGEIVEVVSWPYPVRAQLSAPARLQKSTSSRTVTLPAGTVYLGAIWEPWAWPLVLEGKVRGYSMGGTARRVEVDLPTI